METCGNCKHWDTTGFGFRNGSEKGPYRRADVGKCQLVVRSWWPISENKMIALNGTEHARWACELISVITRREFGCNQFKSEIT